MNSKTRIFIAEDEKTLCEIYTERFLRANYEVTCFGNGLDLLEALATDTPDVILLDINMPEMNGLEVLKSIKENFASKDKQNIPVIVWSNLSSDTDVSAAKKSGATEYLKKVEFSGDDLVQRVSSILKK